ncbi:hypothetical protein K7640_15075 [Micromonospora sp. PLK6-60]|uniref:hypothetical protein n=1 Tax=Micromonospora sp. PLK6-60 TaxID=2873383 RepID=UPI001CA73D72|nr:hypothetical protein [Micromonospora sp. PLK6-60]MBY8873156.1 hypothetical protein [Micromonospora sp. PLK6-60]
MSTQVPRLLAGLVDDAAVFPPGSAPLAEAVAAHRTHRAAWYADLVGPLLVPASALPALPDLLGPDERLAVGVIGDVPIGRLDAVLAEADPRLTVRQVEAAVAKRGEDPQPGLADLLKLAERPGGTPVYAEIPLTFGLLGALDTLAAARSAGAPVAAKFRTGGLAAELFPTPVELAAVICACRDRELPFKLTAGLHHAIRHLDPETGFTHHGFGNVLAATLTADGGAEVADVATLLAATDPVTLVEPARAHRDDERPLWIGYGSCSITEPLTDLIRLGLVNGGYEA